MDDLFFTASKIFWILASPYSVVCIWIGLVTLCLWLKKALQAFVGLVCLLLTLFFVGLFPVGDWVLAPLENTYPENPPLDDVRGIIVLSGAENLSVSASRQQAVLNDASERLLSFVVLARRFPDAQLLFTGGSGSLLRQELKGADVARRLLIDQGIDISRVEFERESRNTYENALLSQKIVGEDREKWVIITSSSHMPRAMRVFCKIGWEVMPYPVDFRTSSPVEFRLGWNIERSLRLISLGLKERIGTMVYWLTDKAC